jgi:hypothetical protein
VAFDETFEPHVAGLEVVQPALTRQRQSSAADVFGGVPACTCSSLADGFGQTLLQLVIERWRTAHAVDGGAGFVSPIVPRYRRFRDIVRTGGSTIACTIINGFIDGRPEGR